MRKKSYRLAYRQANGERIDCLVKEYALLRWTNRQEAEKRCDEINEARRKKIKRDVGKYIVEEVSL